MEFIVRLAPPIDWAITARTSFEDNYHFIFQWQRRLAEMVSCHDKTCVCVLEPSKIDELFCI